MNKKTKTAVTGLALAGTMGMGGCWAAAVGGAAYLIGKETEAQAIRDAARIQAGGIRGPHWTGRPIESFSARYLNDVEYGKLCIYEPGVQFIGNEGGWVSIGYGAILDIDSSEGFLFDDELRISTTRGVQKFAFPNQGNVTALEAKIERRARLR